MKKIAVLCLSIFMVLLLSACGTTFDNGYNTSVDSTENYDNSNNITSNGKNYETVCNHNWNEATCTTPKICSICNTVEGNAKGHNWNSATCQTAKKCKICNITEGGIGECADNGNGNCKYCGEDLYLKKIKDNLKVQLIVPSVGASNNYYFQVKYVNHTGSTIYLSCFATGNGNLCNNYEATDYGLENDYQITISYYCGLTKYDRYEEKYKIMYLDNQSLAYTTIDIDGKAVFVKFGTNGITDMGYSLQDIDVY